MNEKWSGKNNPSSNAHWLRWRKGLRTKKFWVKELTREWRNTGNAKFRNKKNSTRHGTKRGGLERRQNRFNLMVVKSLSHQTQRRCC